MLKTGKLFALPLFLFLFLAISTSPVSADVPIFSGLWDAIKCSSDLNCLVRGAASAGENFAVRTVVGKDFTEVTKTDVKSMLEGKWDRGLAGATDNLLASMYNNPPNIHLANYFQEKISNNILNSPVQATVGTDFLQPIQTIWDQMRNVSYGLFLIVMVAIGLMIILRKEIAPRVVISFTNALPRIVIGLVLITFSFPLVALAVDVGLVFGSELVQNTFGPTLPNLTAPSTLADTEQGFATGNATRVIGGVIGILGNVKDILLSLALGLIFSVAALIVYLLASIRLLISYFKIVLATIFSPLIILFGSLPGQEGVLTDLTKGVLVNVLTFPATVFFLMLGLKFALMGGSDFPFFTLNTTANISIKAASAAVSFLPIGSILALLTVALAWKAPSMIEEALGVGGKPKGKR